MIILTDFYHLPRHFATYPLITFGRYMLFSCLVYLCFTSSSNRGDAALALGDKEAAITTRDSLFTQQLSHKLLINASSWQRTIKNNFVYLCVDSNFRGVYTLCLFLLLSCSSFFFSTRSTLHCFSPLSLSFFTLSPEKRETN